MTNNIDETTQGTTQNEPVRSRYLLASALYLYAIGIAGTGFLLNGIINEDTGNVIAGLGLLYFTNSKIRSDQAKETYRLLGRINDNLEYLVTHEKNRESN